MMYIFPLQFGLHNVFTSQTDTTKTAQKFQDYTLREDEIAAMLRTRCALRPDSSKIPKRLRGAAKHLVQRLQIAHNRCSYSELLQHYCPSALETPRGSQSTKTKQAGAKLTSSSTTAHGSGQQTSTSVKETKSKALTAQAGRTIVDLATPVSGVSAFCQAVLSKIIPNDFWGTREGGVQNRTAFLKKVHHFVRLRRFESMSLSEILQDLKVKAPIPFHRLLC